MTASNGVCACAALANGNVYYGSTPIGQNDSNHVATATARNVVPIALVDFWPACIDPIAALACDAIFERFDALVQRANKWLQRRFAELDLVACETMQKKVIFVHDIYMPSSAYVMEEDHHLIDSCYITGLRLWYRHRGRPSRPPHLVLGFLDFVPSHVNRGHKRPRFETLQQTMDKLNDKLREFPLPDTQTDRERNRDRASYRRSTYKECVKLWPVSFTLNGLVHTTATTDASASTEKLLGVPCRVVGVDTATLKLAPEDCSGLIEVDSLETMCADEYNTHQLSFIRLFYVKDRPRFETIGIEDIHPDALDEGGVFRPALYTPFPDLVDAVAAWVQKHPVRHWCERQT
ncbi:hypothetical protein LSAT2_018751 [Lamellibrachia satsuma]|nr:hypothetical protein LSAT2_018751 [Lamellibrachia satsuma]